MYDAYTNTCTLYCCILTSTYTYTKPVRSDSSHSLHIPSPSLCVNCVSMALLLSHSIYILHGVCVCCFFSGKWRRIKNYDPFYSPHHSRFLFCFRCVCVCMWMLFFIVEILFFRRIPEIRSRQFHLLLTYLSMTAAAFSSYSIQLSFRWYKTKIWYLRPVSFGEKSVRWKSLCTHFVWNLISYPIHSGWIWTYRLRI